jgi:hypothetical protein
MKHYSCQALSPAFIITGTTAVFLFLAQGKPETALDTGSDQWRKPPFLITLLLSHKESLMSSNQHSVLIKKASGHTEAFDVKKLRSSLKNAGAGEQAIAEVVSEIEDWVYDGSRPLRSIPAPSSSSGR